MSIEAKSIRWPFFPTKTLPYGTGKDLAVAEARDKSIIISLCYSRERPAPPPSGRRRIHFPLSDDGLRFPSIGEAEIRTGRWTRRHRGTKKISATTVSNRWGERGTGLRMSHEIRGANPNGGRRDVAMEQLYRQASERRMLGFAPPASERLFRRCTALTPTDEVPCLVTEE
jgi:hypothetical protein